MTLLGAIRLGDRYLFAADNLVIDGTPDGELPPVVRERKLWQLERMPSVVWGFVGLQPTGHAFRDWIQHQAFASWTELEDAAVDALAPLNRRDRERSEAAGADFEGTEILIGGYIGDDARLRLLDCDGHVNSENDPTFVGFGKSPAIVAWRVLSAAVPISADDRENAFRLVMDTTCDAIRNLGGPPLYEVAAP